MDFDHAGARAGGVAGVDACAHETDWVSDVEKERTSGVRGVKARTMLDAGETLFLSYSEALEHQRPPLKAEVEAALAAIHFEAAMVERPCKECGAINRVPFPTYLGPVEAREPSLATKEILDQHLPRDTGATDVRELVSLVDSVSSLGSWDLPRTLGHPLVLQRLVEYTTRFACPVCDPWSFGMSRAYTAYVMSHGILRFHDAATLVEETQALVVPTCVLQSPRYYDYGKLKRLDVRGLPREVAEVVSQLETTLVGIKAGMGSHWFKGWAL